MNVFGNLTIMEIYYDSSRLILKYFLFIQENIGTSCLNPYITLRFYLLYLIFFNEDLMWSNEKSTSFQNSLSIYLTISYELKILLNLGFVIKLTNELISLCIKAKKGLHLLIIIPTNRFSHLLNKWKVKIWNFCSASGN